MAATGGYETGYRHIIHVAGPRWRDGESGEPEVLASCYENVLAKAQELGVTSIAFPSISTGAYRFPVELAAPIALRELQAAKAFDRIIVALRDPAAIRAYAHAWER
ncbi:hypothetical protein EON81_01370 [bacterium]|nr:MAG: hypothetical protein EON81_01370 [bacterium]